jgi:DNA-binding transcriptional regulator LsrR (DeoR family)
MYYQENIKRGKIAKTLRLSADEVTGIVEKFKKGMKNVVEELESRPLTELNENTLNEILE